MPNTFDFTDGRTDVDVPSRTGFLDLPYELRHQVYCYWIPRRQNISTVLVSSRSLRYGFYDECRGADCSTLQALQLSKQISEECLNILYGENTFHVCLNDCGEHELECFFTEQNMRRVRHLFFVAESEIFPSRFNGRLIYSPSTPNESLWATILSNLRSLTIFVMLPTEAHEYPTLEEKIAEWVEWITPYLQCLGKYISKTSQVLIVDDGDRDATDLVEKHLSPSCRLQRSCPDDYTSRWKELEWDRLLK